MARVHFVEEDIKTFACARTASLVEIDLALMLTTVTILMAAMARKPYRGKSPPPAARGAGGFGAPKAAPLSLDEVVASFPTRLPDDVSSDCVCGSGNKYIDCCRPFHQGELLPESPERCLRTRYSGFAHRLPSYIISTTDKTNSEYMEDKVKWARRLHKEAMFDGFKFDGLEVGQVEPGKSDKESFLSLAVTLTPVDPKTKVPTQDAPMRFYEKSRFVKRGGAWLYAAGDVTTDAMGFKDRVLNSQADLKEMEKDVGYVKKLLKDKGVTPEEEASEAVES